jgi:hypothetical protein
MSGRKPRDLGRNSVFVDFHSRSRVLVTVVSGAKLVRLSREGWPQEVGPHAAVRQPPVGGDVESCEPPRVALRNDQHRVIGRHGHAVWEGYAITDLPSRAVRGDESDNPGSEIL